MQPATDIICVWRLLSCHDADIRYSTYLAGGGKYALAGNPHLRLRGRTFYKPYLKRCPSGNLAFRLSRLLPDKRYRARARMARQNCSPLARPRAPARALYAAFSALGRRSPHGAAPLFPRVRRTLAGHSSVAAWCPLFYQNSRGDLLNRRRGTWQPSVALIARAGNVPWDPPHTPTTAHSLHARCTTSPSPYPLPHTPTPLPPAADDARAYRARWDA